MNKTDRGMQEHGSLTNALVLSLILLFAVLSIALIVLGTQAYQSISDTARENAQRRATAGYLLSRIQTFDRNGAMTIEHATLDGEEICILVLSEEIDGEIYQTRMYCADGMLREQTVMQDIPLETAQDGEAIAQLEHLDVRMQGNLLTMEFMHQDGQVQTLHAMLHSGGGDE